MDSESYADETGLTAVQREFTCCDSVLWRGLGDGKGQACNYFEPI